MWHIQYIDIHFPKNKNNYVKYIKIVKTNVSVISLMLHTVIHLKSHEINNDYLF